MTTSAIRPGPVRSGWPARPAAQRRPRRPARQEPAPPATAARATPGTATAAPSRRARRGSPSRSGAPSEVMPPPITTIVHVDSEDEHANGGGNIIDEALAHFDREGVAGGGGLEEVLNGTGMLGRPLARDRRARRQQLEAAALPAAAQRAGGIDRDVPDLARRPARAAPEPAAQHQAGREPGAEVEVRHRALRSMPEQVERAERGDVHVVLEPHPNAEPLGQFVAEGESVEAEVDGVRDAAGCRIHRPRNADADRPELVRRRAQPVGEPRHGSHRGRDDRLRSEAGRQAQLVDHQAGRRRSRRPRSWCRRCPPRPSRARPFDSRAGAATASSA